MFKGGDGFDTLVFSHSLNGDGQLFIDLSSGIGMFGVVRRLRLSNLLILEAHPTSSTGSASKQRAQATIL